MNPDVFFQDILEHSLNILSWIITELNKLRVKEQQDTATLPRSRATGTQTETMASETTTLAVARPHPFKDLIETLQNIQKILFVLSNDSLTPQQRNYKNNEFVLQRIHLIQLSNNTIFESITTNNYNHLPNSASEAIVLLNSIQSLTNQIINYPKDYKSNHQHQMIYPS